MQGKGLNSIRIRFTIMIVAFVALAAASMLALDRFIHLGSISTTKTAALLVLAVLIPGIVTYAMAGKLTNLIHELRKSTDAVAAGNFDEAVNVNCNCEIGGLADSFRTMVARLNSNILRMNVLAYSDKVTELPNRAVITHVLGKALQPGRAAPFAGTIMFIDLDKFKQVNDTLGHDAGDELLRQASLRILKQGFDRTPETIDNCMSAFGELCDRPPSDIVFVRFAGDEFVALLPGVTEQSAVEAYAKRVIACLEQPFHISKTDVTIGASIGIASTPDDTVDACELLNFADLAMYAAKQGGRSRYAFFDSTMRESALQRVNIERELREAIPLGQIVVYYQPKMMSDGIGIAGMEALARWNHPMRGILSPKDFIEVAEQSGLIESLGDWVLRCSMNQCAIWNAAGRPMRVSVNVSQLQFAKPDFVGKVMRALAASGAPPHLIEIEITETAALVDPLRTMETLSRFREAGLSIAIDDFGCGFSNLSLLAQLPFDTLKVDRSLVECIGLDRRAEKVIKAIIDMGHSLGHTIVAEGVETMKQLAFLQHNKCEMVQGFLFARPMPPDALVAWEESRSASPASVRLAEVESRWQSA